jgi:hypothetical protein
VGNLAAALSAQANRTPGPRCSVGVLLTTLDTNDTKALLAALALDSGIKGSEIAKALRDEGHHMKGHTVQRHRNGECGCGTR